TIDRLAVTVVQWPAPTVPAGVYATVDSVAGRVARVTVFKGEAIVPGRLAPDGTGAGLEVKIPPGKRAMSVRINDVSGVGGLIQPNARVDILLTLNPNENNTARTAKMFMENMKILAMGAQVQRGDDGRPIQTTVATLEVTPQESERLAIASSQGQIQLVLRGYGDPDSAGTKGASARDLMPSIPVPIRSAPPEPARRTTVHFRTPDQVAPPPVAPVVARTIKPPPPESLSVKVFRGNKASEQKFQKDSAAKRDSTKD
ncbi:MAG: Flp pilus assembly protein CpaB, partial [Gemmatimonadaceae bacterium]